MLKLSPCIEMLWKDVEFPQRISRAAAVGFKAFEFWGWWDKDVDVIEKAAKDAGLPVAACCVKTSFDEPAKGLLVPESKEPMINAVKDCIRVAPKLNCKTFIATTGNTLKDVPRAEQLKACIAVLKAAAPVAEDGGITIVLEPLNTLVNHKNYFLSSSVEAFEIIDEVGSPAVKLLFDIYHQQITEGNVTRNIFDHLDKIGHFHVADNPDRMEPGTGEINYPYLFKRISESNYAGYMGLEFQASQPERTDEILRALLASTKGLA